WNLALLAKQFNKPFIIWGASVGPFKSDYSLNLAKKCLDAVSMITARENSTQEYLKEIKPGINTSRVFDSAFLLKPKEVTLPEFDRNAETIGFNISPIYYQYTDGLTKEDVLEISKQFVVALSKSYNILLIPHVMIDNNHDFAYMKELEDHSNNIKIVDSKYDCRELKYVISKCKYFIGARTHATIAAFSQNVPTISLGYSMKARGLNDEIFDSRDYLIEANEFNLDTLNSKFTHLANNRNMAIDKFNAANRNAYEMVHNAINLLKSTVNY
ncbi:MAG: hypothetical protein CVV63_05160, partial [Tenericutes bacterium HGW-Tenericutes-8]